LVLPGPARAAGLCSGRPARSDGLASRPARELQAGRETR